MYTRRHHEALAAALSPSCAREAASLLLDEFERLIKHLDDGDSLERLKELRSRLAALTERVHERAILAALVQQINRKVNGDTAYDVKIHIDTRLDRHARGTCRCARPEHPGDGDESGRGELSSVA